MTNKSILIYILGGLLILLVAAGSIGIIVINSRAETMLKDRLDQAIVQANLEGVLSYEDVKVSGLKGRVGINGVVFDDGTLGLNAETVGISLPVGEALKLVQDPDHAVITDLSISVNGLNVKDSSQELDYETDQLNVQFQGNLPLELFSADFGNLPADLNPGIKMLNFEVDGSQALSPVGTMKFGHLIFETTGDIALSDLEKAGMASDYISLLKLLEGVKIDFSDYSFDLDEEVRSSMFMGVTMFFGPMPFLEDPENWKIDSFILEGGVSGNSAGIENYVLKTNWIDMKGNASIGISELGPQPPLKAEVYVDDYLEDLRPLLEMFAYQIAQAELPEGNSFTFRVSVPDEQSMPEIVFE